MLLASWVVVGCTVPFALDPSGVDFAIENVRLAGRPAPANVASSEGEVTILLRNGRIAAIGAGLAIPPEAERIDGVGLTAWPGFIDAFSDLGLAPNERSPAASASEGAPQDTGSDAFADTAEASRRGLFPERRGRLLLAALDKDATSKLRLGGFTDVLTAPVEGFLAGQACLIDLSDLPLRDAVVREPGWLHAKLGSGMHERGYPSTTMGTLAHLRQAFLDAQRLQSWRESYKRDPAAVARPPSDDCLDALIAVLDHQLRIAFAADREGDLRRALALAQEFRFDLVLIGAKEGWKCAPELAAARVAVVASLAFPDPPERKGAKLKPPPDVKPAAPPEAKPDAPPAASDASAAAPAPAPAPASAPPPVSGPSVAETWEVADPVLAEPLELFEQRRMHWEEEVRNVERLLAAGVPVALTTRGSSSVPDFFADLRTAIEKGLPADAALRALSATPAELFGASQELGALAPGRAANLSLVEGDLANKERSVRHVFVAGRHFEGAPKKEAKPEEKPKEGAAAAAAGLTGTWSLQPLQPGAHTSSFESKLTLKQEGTKLSGRLESEMGEGELSGSADDAAVRFTIVAQFQGQRFEFKFVGKADGADRLTGTLETPFGKPLEVEAKRAPKGARRQEASR